jgi:hypothetical protein
MRKAKVARAKIPIAPLRLTNIYQPQGEKLKDLSLGNG